jgi:hypothetical protein
MCMKVTCRECGKATWAGCGMHIDSALRSVTEADRCPGWRTGKCTGVQAAYVPKEDPPKDATKSS